MANLTQFHLDCHKLFDGVKLFPIEMDLAKSAFQNPYGLNGPDDQDNVSDGEDVAEAVAEDDVEILKLDQDPACSEMSLLDLSEEKSTTGERLNDNSGSGNLVDFWEIHTNKIIINFLLFQLFSSVLGTCTFILLTNTENIYQDLYKEEERVPLVR